MALVLTALAVVAGRRVADRLGSGGWEDPDGPVDVRDQGTGR
ncbi:hypothetical protein ACRAWF_40200 [Streptomyces sp. L7]